ncbi:MAG: cell filamentation protein Fic [Alcanivorax sp.]|nr:cell filamentation protein Fic [Alcanivorax sp.]
MSADKYGTGQDPYCYPGTRILKNVLGLRNDDDLADAERDLTRIAASKVEFSPPPYDLAYLQRLHRLLFRDVYAWAGELRTIDISKDSTRFCNQARIEPEARKIFARLSEDCWLEGWERRALSHAAAVYYGDLNMIHPFRDGNGRALRLLFEHLVINAGYQIDWSSVTEVEWLQANVNAVSCNYEQMEAVFRKCIGSPITG